MNVRLAMFVTGFNDDVGLCGREVSDFHQINLSAWVFQGKRTGMESIRQEKANAF